MTSKAPWLPVLPDRWKVVQMRRLVTFRNGADYKDVEVDEGGFPIYGSGGEFRRASSYLYDGPSVLFGRKGTTDRPLLVSGKFWTVDTMFYTELGDAIEPRFLHHYATTMPFSYYSTSTALPSMTQGELGGHRMPVPPLEEQCAIADYLDRETGRIDTLIEEQQRLIEMLRERRLDLIRSAVLGDANPFAPPEDAAFTAVGYHFSVTLGKMLDAGKEVRSGDQMLPYIRAANIQDTGLRLDDVKEMPYSEAEAANLNLLEGDLLVVEGGAVGTNALIREEMPGWSFQKTVNRVRPLADWSCAWLGYVLRTYRDIGVIDIVCNKSTIPHLTAEKLRAMRVPSAEPQEQVRVVTLLDRETEKIDAMIVETERFIELARERRAALITAAVTGQIDVREMAA